ncbi:reverse transcriptase domain, reverse transcriptase zinc-binding domain protein [Tanacetum coccineum]
MGDSDWQEVNRGKRRFVFERLNPSQSQKSNIADLAKISLSVYVSNFPSHLTLRELWNIYGKVGTLADVFIAKRKNKLGQMFAFCRYIKVSNSDELIGSLCDIWIGKLRLHANVARFGRNVTVKPSHAGVKATNSVINNDRLYSSSNKTTSYVNAAKASLDEGKRSPKTSVDNDGEDIPVLNLSQTVSYEFPLAILGCYKDFRSIANTRILCRSEGFLDVDFKYLGGLWILFEFKSMDTRNNLLKHEGILSWFSSMKPWHDDFMVEERLVWLEIEGVPLRAWENDTFKSICSKWGEVFFSDDSDICNRLRKRLCIKSTHLQLIFATTYVSLMKTTYVIRIRELCSWTPTFVGDDSASDEEGSLKNQSIEEKEEVHEENEVESVADIFDDIDAAKVDLDFQKVSSSIDGGVQDQSPDAAPINSDPFDLAPLINKTRGKDLEMKGSETSVFPPGSTPTLSHNQHDGLHDHNPYQSVGSESSHKVLGDLYKSVGFSLLERLKETIKVGLALGLNMEGCENTLAALIANNGERMVDK